MRSLAGRITTPAGFLAAVGAGFCLVLGCAIAAGELLAGRERADGSTSLDSSVTSWMVEHRARGVTALGRALSLIGSQEVLLPVVLTVAGALLWRRRLAIAALLIVAWAPPIGLYHFTKLVVGRHRPPKELWLTHATGASFPSGHATQSLSAFVALALVAAAARPPARPPALVLAVILAAGVGCSRVYLGVHWATDVLAGWLVAAAWIAFVLWLRAPAASIERRSRMRASGARSER